LPVCATLTVVKPAEFQIIDVSVSPETVAPGETYTVTAVVRNIGGQGGTATVKFTINGTLIGERSTYIPAGGEEEVSLSPDAPTEPGSYSVCAELV